MQNWDQFILDIKNVIEGTFHTNDLGKDESELALTSAVDRLAEANGMPKTNWECW